MDTRDVKFFGGLVLLLVGALGLVIGLASWAESSACESIHEVTGRRTEWRFNGGCFVEANGGMVPEERWRSNEVGYK